jgi:trimeric autotransporter adhesin
MLLQEALLLTTLCNTNSSSSSSSSSSNSSSSGSSEILSRIAPSLLRSRVTFHLTVLALFAVASHSGRAPQRCAATVQRQLLQHGLTALLTTAVSEPAAAAAATASTAATAEHSSSSNSNSCYRYDSTSSVHYGDRLSAQFSSAAVAPGLHVTVCDATVLAAVLESTARIYGTTSTTSTATAAATTVGDSHSDGVDAGGVPACVMAAGQQAVLCAPVDCASGYATVQLLHSSSDADATAGSDTLMLPLRALYATPSELLLRASELAIGSSVRIAQRDWLQHVLQSLQTATTSNSDNSSNDNSVLLSIAGEAAAVVALGNSDWVGVQTAAGTEAAVPLAALRLATSASTTAVAAAACSSNRRGSSTSTAVSRKSKLAAVTRRRRRGSATSETARIGDLPLQLTSPLQHSSSRQRAHSSNGVYTNREHSSNSSSTGHSAAQRSGQPPACGMQSSAAVEASISSSAESGVRLLPTDADRAVVSRADHSEAAAVAAKEPFSLARLRGPPPPRRPSNTTASATTAAASSTQRALYREPELTQGHVLGHASHSHDDDYHTDAAQLWGTDGRVLRRGSAPAAVAAVYDSPSPPQRPRSARVRSASLSAAAATATAAAVCTEAALLHTEHIDHLQQQQQQQSQQRRRRPSTASANSQYSSGSVPLHSATLYFEQQPPPPFSERRASSSSSSSGAVCTGPACRTGIASANSSAGNSDSPKQQHTAASAKPWRPPAGSSAALKQQDIATVRKLNAKVAARLARTVRTERARDEAVYDRLLASRVRRAQAVAADSAAAVVAATATATAVTAAAVPETASDDASADASAAALAAELDELSSTGVDERVQDVLARLQRRRRSSSASGSSGSGAVVRDSASWKAELRRKLGLPPAAVAADVTARSSKSCKGSWGYSERSSNSPQVNGSQRPRTAPGRRGSAEQEHSDDDICADSSNVQTLLI